MTLIIEQAINLSKATWNVLTEEQKEDWYADGTVSFTQLIFDILHVDVDKDISYEEFELVVGCIYE